ncbi:hypothetical protein RRG08_048534 [Elysia crispata]|uniref:Uncharacterized protein n=1 Tax=Elysia crispata TaxID=231223 RepID=A0AAE1B5W6_9GAST|nr:hypothetical protein RRG08_048534 [Elysia crispata]
MTSLTSGVTARGKRKAIDASVSRFVCYCKWGITCEIGSKLSAIPSRALNDEIPLRDAFQNIQNIRDSSITSPCWKLFVLQ